MLVFKTIKFIFIHLEAVNKTIIDAGLSSPAGPHYLLALAAYQ